VHVTTEVVLRARAFWVAFAWAVLAASALLGLTLAGCTDAHATRRGDLVDVSSYPKEIQEAYPVFAQRCSRCHTLARPLNAHIEDPEHWVRYVARMRRQPGSGINHDNAATILRFLLFYHSSDRDRAATPAPAPQQSRQP
jgi:hypothetical protein